MSVNIGDVIGRLIGEMDKVVVGYAGIKKYSVAALLADQHVLLEGLPGTAKSLFVEVFQRAVSNSASVRIQMTADVKPMDIVGVKVYNPGEGKFDFEFGPLVAKNFALIDEINRAPGKTLSAVLSAMQERRIYIAGREIVLPDPYFVMATQNPIEQEGVYPLPEAAVDRFAMKLIVPYATADEEVAILKNEALDGRDPQNVVRPVVSTEEIVAMREQIKKGIYVSDAALQYIVALVRATRPGLAEHSAVVSRDSEFKKLLQVGGSVRGEQALRGMARVLAAMKGRMYVLPEDIQEIALPVLRHRTALSFEASTEGKTTDMAITTILKHVPFHKDNGQYTPPSAK